VDRPDIEAAPTPLGARLAAEGLLAELYVVGGAARVLEVAGSQRVSPVTQLFVQSPFPAGVS
jgi:hypothetical protein